MELIVATPANPVTPPPLNVDAEIERATKFGQALDDIVFDKGPITIGEKPDRDHLLLAYWTLTSDYDKSILSLMRNKYYGGAFALLRPLIEALVRAHVVLMGS